MTDCVRRQRLRVGKIRAAHIWKGAQRVQIKMGKDREREI